MILVPRWHYIRGHLSKHGTFEIRKSNLDKKMKSLVMREGGLTIIVVPLFNKEFWHENDYHTWI